MVSVLDSGAEGPGFKSQLRRCRVTVLGKLFTPIVPLFTKQRNWFKGCEGNCRPGGKLWQPTVGFMTRVTCRLTAKNRDQLRNPYEGCNQFRCLVNRGTRGVNILPKTVIRQRRSCDLNPGPFAPESGTLTTRLPGFIYIASAAVAVDSSHVARPQLCKLARHGP